MVNVHKRRVYFLFSYAIVQQEYHFTSPHIDTQFQLLFAVPVRAYITQTKHCGGGGRAPSAIRTRSRCGSFPTAITTGVHKSDIFSLTTNLMLCRGSHGTIAPCCLLFSGCLRYSALHEPDARLLGRRMVSYCGCTRCDSPDIY